MIFFFCQVHQVPMQFSMYAFGWTCHLCARALQVTTTNTSTPHSWPVDNSHS